MMLMLIIKCLKMKNDFKMNFTVLLSVYAKESPDFLLLALDSIWKNQSLRPTQIVLVKDGPLTNDLNDVIDIYKKKSPLKVISLEKNVGLGKALNIGLEKCDHDLVARMDTDDISLPDRFKIQIAEFKKDNKLSVVGGQVSEFKNNPLDIRSEKKVPLDSHLILEFAKKRNPLNHPSVMFRKNDIISVGSYQHCPYFEDYFLWCRLLKKGFKIKNVNNILLYFRIGNDMIGRRIGWSYVRKEINFFKNILELKFINRIQFLMLILIRIPFRLLPKKVLGFLYLKLLRK